jgi:hypothetical protein
MEESWGGGDDGERRGGGDEGEEGTGAWMDGGGRGAGVGEAYCDVTVGLLQIAVLPPN